jgi:hypothetical protein
MQTPPRAQNFDHSSLYKTRDYDLRIGAYKILRKQINFSVEDSFYEDLRLAAFQKRQSLAAYARDRVLKQELVSFAPVGTTPPTPPITEAEFCTAVTNTETGKISLQLILTFLREKEFLTPE